MKIYLYRKNDSIRRFYQNILKILDNKDIDISIYQTSKINDEWISFESLMKILWNSKTTLLDIVSLLNIKMILNLIH